MINMWWLIYIFKTKVTKICVYSVIQSKWPHHPHPRSTDEFSEWVRVGKSQRNTKSKKEKEKELNRTHLQLKSKHSLSSLIWLSMTAPCPFCDVTVPWAELERYCFCFWDTNSNANEYWDFFCYCCCSFPLISLVNALAAGMLTVTLNWKMSSKSKKDSLRTGTWPSRLLLPLLHLILTL